MQRQMESSPCGWPPAPNVAQSADQFEATDAATQVTFKFPRPVDVTNGRTLSIPILDRQVPAERLALYQADTGGAIHWPRSDSPATARAERRPAS